ncbi:MULTISPECIES: MCE family protein [Mycobacteriaceae]|jgi:phospholipid/cholesterol/gamma-HCH transport system substrate-binding protein|uniref:Mammalian cell entry protein n=2 Tax=Mycobacteriaceae TaxID=1762 RepID=A0A172UH59_9MYCO|nr:MULTISPECIES: MCE family protein [Mycobacteriaceae]MCF6391227.1 MCE family protein [Mycobacterium sp. MBM]ANE78285.1 mammalian cell entry protein [Mycobacterium adipatum]MCW1825063.1 MCE family protein [Mycolicibacterium senegalense]OBB05828.1 mammalian cell entry protein [Mycolicibacterium conceptionense]OBF03759.1 mammalian cell entry protein [Mycolicibacterium conceptionense]
MSRRTLVWLTAVIAAALAVATTLITNRAGTQPITVTAHFEDAIGLYEGNTVAVLGMQVGHVDRITTKGDSVEVTLVLDDGVDIPADVQAVTVSTSILTDRHVELTPPYRGGPKLGDGDVIGLGRTRTPVEFDRTLAMIDRLAVALRGNGEGSGPLADLVNVGAQIATDNGEDLKSTLSELSSALRLETDHGARTKENINTIATSLDILTQSAAENEQTIREFGSNVHQLSDILADESLGTGTTGSKINQILMQVASVLESRRDGLKTTAADSRAITQALVDYQREVAEFFNLAPMTLDNVWNAIDVDNGAVRLHALADKILFDSQLSKEMCNLIGLKQLGCATGTLRDYGPDFGLTGMLELMAGVEK